MFVQNQFASMEQMVGQMGSAQVKNPPVNAKELKLKQEGLSFQEILNKTKGSSEENEDLKFSKHASLRLKSRNIDLSSSQLKRLESGTQKAREKGIQESLVMVDNLAFIVNVVNNTVITAVSDTDHGVFTNIDGAVIG